jgi:hypothetical protein
MTMSLPMTSFLSFNGLLSTLQPIVTVEKLYEGFDGVSSNLDDSSVLL